MYMKKLEVVGDLVAKSCPTLYNPMDCSPLGSSVHGIFQARVLEWVASAFSNLNMTIRQFQWEFKGAEGGQCHFSRKNL